MLVTSINRQDWNKQIHFILKDTSVGSVESNAHCPIAPHGTFRKGLG